MTEFDKNFSKDANPLLVTNITLKTFLNIFGQSHQTRKNQYFAASFQRQIIFKNEVIKKRPFYKGLAPKLIFINEKYSRKFDIVNDFESQSFGIHLTLKDFRLTKTVVGNCRATLPPPASFIKNETNFVFAAYDMFLRVL